MFMFGINLILEMSFYVWANGRWSRRYPDRLGYEVPEYGRGPGKVLWASIGGGDKEAMIRKSLEK